MGEFFSLGTKWKNDHNGPGMGDWSSYDLVPTSRPASIVLYGGSPVTYGILIVHGLGRRLSQPISFHLLACFGFHLL